MTKRKAGSIEQLQSTLYPQKKMVFTSLNPESSRMGWVAGAFRKSAKGNA